ncbi:MAG: hypothetical protein CSA23_03925 [Deltaproteobacteria bacterium]|nr:MAG: hypothetical protein CSA23_03925 [Deltaproteobacteria bacterium]
MMGRDVDLLYDDRTVRALDALKTTAGSLAGLLALDSQPAVAAWQRAIESRLIPRLRPDFPLVAAICGGGSSGKSTLFNTLVGEAVSPAGGRAGINRRPLIALAEAHRERAGVADALVEPFGCSAQTLSSAAQLTDTGSPLLHYADGLPACLALLDTPDFDTGAGGNYQNREMAEQSLGAADVLIYIFTNANYNNRDNTDFIARMLTAVGTRDSMLVYRACSALSDAEILDHAGTVARQIYGERAGSHVLGVYRAGEDNRVAAGERPVTILPMGDTCLGLMDALKQMDPRKIRGDLHRSVFEDVVRQGRGFLREARESADHLAFYLQGLRTVQRQRVQEALAHLPMDAVVRRFSRIWQDTDPSHVKFMRKTGRVVESPVRLAMRAARWIGSRRDGMPRRKDEDRVAATMEADLVRAANRLRKAAVDAEIEIHFSGTGPAADVLGDKFSKLASSVAVRRRTTGAGQIAYRIPVHPVVTGEQEALRGGNWSAVIDEMLARRESMDGFNRQMDAELHRLVSEQRFRMTAFDQIRQTFAAMLNIIPATAAVTYVLHTGDPVGATGIKVKLAGLFGLNDLYALVAIPATTGMKKAERKQLETLLAPVAGTWLSHKLAAIESLFEEKITGALLQKGQAVENAAAGCIETLARHLALCQQVSEASPWTM